MTSRSCVICGEEESEQSSHIELPCWNHWVCKDDLADFFVRATENESLYPPRCCDEMLLLDQFEQHVPQDVQVDFMMKAQGEYQVMQKQVFIKIRTAILTNVFRFRVYCANAFCTVFLSPTGHITDPDTNITYAICEGTDCGKVTCVACRMLIVNGIKGHTCEVQEDELKFKETAKEQGYQQCSICSRTVELAEACNHITCQCGHSFCYVCGKDWSGLHGCPQYGRAMYDEEGYNQEGFHQKTGLNRDGLTRLQQRRRDRGEESEDEEEDDERENREEATHDWDVLQHLDEETRAVINMLPQNELQESLEMLRIQLMETQGITFDQPQPNQPEDDEPVEDDQDDDGRDGQDGEEENLEHGDGLDPNVQEQGEIEADDQMQEVTGDGGIPSLNTQFSLPQHVGSSGAEIENISGESAMANEQRSEHIAEGNLRRAQVPAEGHLEHGSYGAF